MNNIPNIKYIDIPDKSAAFSAASGSVFDTPASGHEHRTGAGEGEQATQETPEEDCKVIFDHQQYG